MKVGITSGKHLTEEEARFADLHSESQFIKNHFNQ